MRGTQIRLVTVFVAFGLALSTGAAKAGTTFTVSEVGSDVLIQASGSYDLTGAGLPGQRGVQHGFINSSLGLAVGGPLSDIDSYALTSNPGAFGTGGFVDGTPDVGNVFGLDVINSGGFITVPDGYTGGPLAGTTSFSGHSFASLGLTPGTFVYGIPNDTLTVVVVPEPGSAALGAALAGGFWLRRRRPADA